MTYRRSRSGKDHPTTGLEYLRKAYENLECQIEAEAPDRKVSMGRPRNKRSGEVVHVKVEVVVSCKCFQFFENVCQAFWNPGHLASRNAKVQQGYLTCPAPVRPTESIGHYILKYGQALYTSNHMQLKIPGPIRKDPHGILYGQCERGR